MGKAKSIKRNSSAKLSSPYTKLASKATSKAASKTAAVVPTTSKNPLFKFNTGLGQHILKNQAIADRIVDAAGIQPHDTVLEVGPGPGVLTTRLLDRAKAVTAVEIDPRMAAELSCRVQGTPKQKKLRVLVGDFIKLGADEVPAHDVCVSNTPYQISSPLIFKLLSLARQPRTTILMLQREFAQRLTARPGETTYSRLSVNVQFFATVSHVMKVGPKNFSPPPQVESSVVRLEPRLGRPEISFSEWDGLLRVCFMRKNRTIRAGWTGGQVRNMVAKNWLTWATLYPGRIGEDERQFLKADDGKGNEGGEEDEMNTYGCYDDDEDMDMNAEGKDSNDGGMDAEDDEEVGFFGKKLPAGRALSVAGVKTSWERIETLIKDKIERILESTELGPKRAAKCDENDFLRLLTAFNEEGLHFS